MEEAVTIREFRSCYSKRYPPPGCKETAAISRRAVSFDARRCRGSSRHWNSVALRYQQRRHGEGRGVKDRPVLEKFAENSLPLVERRPLFASGPVNLI